MLLFEEIKIRFYIYICVFLYEILQVCLMKYTYSCFSSQFRFLGVILLSVQVLVTIISLPCYFKFCLRLLVLIDLRYLLYQQVLLHFLFLIVCLCHLWGVWLLRHHNFFYSLVYLSEIFVCPSKEWPRVSYTVVYLFDEFYPAVPGFVKS